MDLCDIREIKALLGRHGFYFSKSMGQNFLIAGWVPQDIADAAGLDKSCAVLEIGPGIGPLTRQLSLRAGKVAAVELDSSRMGTSSVDLNDEAMNLMQYSKSLNAAYRLMTTIDEALDRLINNTGIVGR